MRQSSKERKQRIGIGMCILASALMAMAGVGASPAVAAPLTKCATSTGTSWDQNQTGACRFTPLADFGGAAVRDNNTGLVWEQAPDATPLNWVSSTNYCASKTVPTVNGPTGWRLPSVIELRSVQDRSLPVPYVPTSVFTNVQPNGYWSATTDAAFPTGAWAANFNLNISEIPPRTNGVDKTLLLNVWCVRGPMNADQY